MAEKDRSYHCPCDAWGENFPAINAPFLLPLTAIGEYKGVPFKYCPWCQKELVEEGEVHLQCTCYLGRSGNPTGGCSVHGWDRI